MCWCQTPGREDITIATWNVRTLRAEGKLEELLHEMDRYKWSTHFNKAVTDTAAALLDKQRRKRKPWVTPEILELCDQRRDLKKKRGEPEGAKDYREIKRKIRTEIKMAKEIWIQDQCQEVEACLRKNNSIPASQ